MKYIKQEIISKLKECHDEIKKHPFRTSFLAKHIGDYKYLLYHLTEIWCDLIWRCEDITTFEQNKLRMFGAWIHDYRQYLREHDKTTFPMNYFDYYEQMLQITHIYIDTGNCSTFYNLDTYFQNDGKYVKSTRYEWLTKDDCGIESDILPLFMPTETLFYTDEEYIKNTSWAWRDEDGKKAAFQTWVKHTKPVLEWLNEQRKDTNAKNILRKCTLIDTSPCKH